jgi:hypothetical protein
MFFFPRETSAIGSGFTVHGSQKDNRVRGSGKKTDATNRDSKTTEFANRPVWVSRVVDDFMHFRLFLNPEP